MTTQDAIAGGRTWHLDWQGVLFALVGVSLGMALISARGALYAIQGGVATAAALLPLSYAFAAGMVATVNPCGVLLLPSLVAYYLGQSGGTPLSAGQQATKALELGVMATLGFVSLFALVGLALGAGGSALAAAFPVGGLLVGIVLAVLGLWLALSGHGLGLAAASRAMDRIRIGDDRRSLFLFGIAYALTSLSCTLPIFLVVAGAALATGDPLTAAGRFVSYALGMGTVLTAVILGTTFFESSVRRTLRGLVPYVHRLAAAFLIGAGIFVTHYWLTADGFLR